MTETKRRTILHCDGNSFFASVESIDHPEYKKVPMAVTGDPAARHGIILAKNDLAKAFHVQTAETIWQAKRKCPNLLLVPASHGKYVEVSKKINLIYQQYTDRVEPFSVDESWLDVTGSEALLGNGEKIANELRERIKKEIGVSISVGVSFNKTFAKLGSDYKKPDATTVITEDNYQDILWPLPIEDMLFVGKNASKIFRLNGVYTIGDLAKLSEKQVIKLVGKTGTYLWSAANGRDDSEVAFVGTYNDPKSISRMVTYDHDLTGLEEVQTGLLEISDEIGTRLRKAALYTTTVSIQIKDPELKVRQKQKKLVAPTDLTKDIYLQAWDLVKLIWQEGMPIRMLTVGVTNLTADCRAQTNLFVNQVDNTKQEQLEHAIDKIRDRYGKDIVKFARNKNSN